MDHMFYYIALGLSLAAPMGPINAAVINRGLRFGFVQAWILALGSLLAEFIYILIVYFGVSPLVNTPIIQVFLWLFGAFVLIYTGIEGLCNKTPTYSRSNSESPSLSRSFFTGFLLSFLNPLSIVFWLGIYGSILASTIHKLSTGTIWFYSGCILIGVMGWDLLVSILSSFFRNMVSEGFIVLVSKVSGVMLLCFGAYFGFHGVQIFFK